MIVIEWQLQIWGLAVVSPRADFAPIYIQFTNESVMQFQCLSAHIPKVQKNPTPVKITSVTAVTANETAFFPTRFMDPIEIEKCMTLMIEFWWNAHIFCKIPLLNPVNYELLNRGFSKINVLKHIDRFDPKWCGKQKKLRYSPLHYLHVARFMWGNHIILPVQH